MINETQSKILKLAKTQDISEMGLRRIARILGIQHPQTVKYHLEQLKKQGLIEYVGAKGTSVKGIPEGGSIKVNLIEIPIVGSANCGEANIFAVESNEGFLRVSSKILKKTKNIFAVRAVGDSMNMAEIDDRSLNDGDFAIVDFSYKSPKRGDYVLSIINGMANIKKFDTDNQGNVILISESHDQNKHPPIYIHREDFGDDNYTVNGKVVQVIKKPSRS